ncbi:MAG: hypothetical protein H6581_23385 [Bacteroidia bacterium]|nr:hypothetical protein [Bacteroidia bacterium]
MSDNKLIQLLGLLDPGERKRFQDYLSSPFFNKREDALVLFQELESRFLNSEKGGTDEEVFADVYRGQDFNYSKLINLKTLLQNLLLNFMAQVVFEQNSALRNRFQLEKLNQARDTKYFPSFYKKALKALEKSWLNEFDLFWEKMLLEEAIAENHSLLLQRDPNPHLPEMSKNLEYAFLLRVIRLITHDLDRQAMFGVKLDLPLAPHVVAYLAAHKNELPPILKCYHELYLLKTLPDPLPAFSNLMALLHDHHQNISREEVQYLYIGLINFGTRSLNDGKLEFLEEIFGLYLEMLELKVLLENNKISPWHFRNIIHVALRCGKFTWTDNFIQNYQDRIAGDHHGNLINFCTGLTFFYQGNFDQAESCFNRVLDDYQDVFFGIDSRAYLLQIYFETGNSLGLESLAHSFRMFLDRNQSISAERRKQYIAFILHLRRLSNIPLKDAKRLEKLKNEIITKSGKGMGSAWLLKKISEIQEMN